MNKFLLGKVLLKFCIIWYQKLSEHLIGTISRNLHVLPWLLFSIHRVSIREVQLLPSSDQAIQFQLGWDSFRFYLYTNRNSNLTPHPQRNILANGRLERPYLPGWKTTFEEILALMHQAEFPIGSYLNPITHGGGVFRTPSNFAAIGDPLKVKYIEIFHADFSYLSIY